jgi:hypothetical protein
MVDGLHIHIQKRPGKPLAIALSGVAKGLWGVRGDGGDHLTNVQCKIIWNCHNEPPVKQIHPNKNREIGSYFL